MAVSATLRFEPGSRERARLRQILGCTDAELETRLAPYATAALEEYVRMFIGERVFTRGSDIREYRLFLLMANVWQRVPEDHEVSALFQTTAGQSRALIRAVLSKFRYDLAATLEGSLKATLAGARRLSDGELQLLVRSANLVDALNERIEEIDASLPRLTPGEGVASYRIKQSAYEQLCRVLGVQPKA
jgi:hypothetical protein